MFEPGEFRVARSVGRWLHRQCLLDIDQDFLKEVQRRGFQGKTYRKTFVGDEKNLGESNRS